MVNPGAPGKASTLSEKDAIYMPSPEYRSAGHGADYGNFKSNPQLDLTIRATDQAGNEHVAEMWLKAVRNEGISVHVPASNELVASIRDRKREISAYIPGLAGIPLVEEKRSRLIVHRSAAAGDANTVLRNMLALLKEETINGENGLELVSTLVAKVMGNFSLKVDFDDNKHTKVNAHFRVGDMGAAGDRAYRPLELAGIGYLQVLQIFCYLVYFRPVLLLVDEPDAHLYPIMQERLVEALHTAANEFDSQVILSTHSPSIVRSLPRDANIIWMKDGRVESKSAESARQLMGWGLLDRKIVLLTEDSRTEMLKALLQQWPELERITAIWPFHGTGKLPTPETLAGFQAIVGRQVELLVHRDRDFLMPDEASTIAAPYEKSGHKVWFTKYSDIEAYWAGPDTIAKYFNITSVEANALIAEASRRAAIDEAALQKMRTKRSEALQQANKRGSLPHYGDTDVLAEMTRDGDQFKVLGKDLLKRLRDVAVERELPKANKYGSTVPQGLISTLAEDLRLALESCLTGKPSRPGLQ